MKYSANGQKKNPKIDIENAKNSPNHIIEVHSYQNSGNYNEITKQEKEFDTVHDVDEYGGIVEDISDEADDSCPKSRYEMNQKNVINSEEVNSVNIIRNFQSNINKKKNQNEALNVDDWKHNTLKLEDGEIVEHSGEGGSKSTLDRNYYNDDFTSTNDSQISASFPLFSSVHSSVSSSISGVCRVVKSSCREKDFPASKHSEHLSHSFLLDETNYSNTFCTNEGKLVNESDAKSHDDSTWLREAYSNELLCRDNFISDDEGKTCNLGSHMMRQSKGDNREKDDFNKIRRFNNEHSNSMNSECDLLELSRSSDIQDGDLCNKNMKFDYRMLQFIHNIETNIKDCHDIGDNIDQISESKKRKHRDKNGVKNKGRDRDWVKVKIKNKSRIITYFENDGSSHFSNFDSGLGLNCGSNDKLAENISASQQSPPPHKKITGDRNYCRANSPNYIAHGNVDKIKTAEKIASNLNLVLNQSKSLAKSKHQHDPKDSFDKRSPLLKEKTDESNQKEGKKFGEKKSKREDKIVKNLEVKIKSTKTHDSMICSFSMENKSTNLKKPTPEKEKLNKINNECETIDGDDIHDNFESHGIVDFSEEEEELLTPEISGHENIKDIDKEFHSKSYTPETPSEPRACSPMKRGNDALDVNIPTNNLLSDRTFFSASNPLTNPVREDGAESCPPVVNLNPREKSLLSGCESIENFKKLNKISEGTYGAVYRALNCKNNKIVALKHIKYIQNLWDEGFPITSLREISILLELKHQNIINVQELVVGKGQYQVFMVMEYIEHELKALLDDNKPEFSIAEKKCLLLQVLHAVEYMHKNWIIHRDLKTSNLLYSNKGILKVCDFGMARKFGDPIRPYTHNVVTLWYRAPELLCGEKVYTQAIDIWSIGCIFAELILRRPLFPGHGEADTLNKIFALCGTPNDENWPKFSELLHIKSGKYFTKIPNYSPSWRETFCSPTSNFAQVSDSLSDLGLKLLQRMLCLCPEKRITASEAISHEYFREKPKCQLLELMPTVPETNSRARRKRRNDRSMDDDEKKQQEIFHDGAFRFGERVDAIKFLNDLEQASKNL